MQAIRDAIARGAPLYNAGEIGLCAAIYASLAETLTTDTSLPPLHQIVLKNSLSSSAHLDDNARAWALRRAFDSLLGDDAFVPQLEASLPVGWPAPGPIARAVIKKLPQYRAARSAGGFMTLLGHITSRSIPMTAPVVTGDSSMSFLYQSSAVGQLGATDGGRVVVEDVPAATVLSLGVRGESDDNARRLARSALDAELAARGLRPIGPVRMLAYCSPMVPSARRYWELIAEVGGSS